MRSLSLSRCFIAFLLLNAFVSKAQLGFRKTFEGLSINSRPQIAGYTDGGYAVVTEIDNPVAPFLQQLAIVRFDSCDNILWSRYYENASYQFQLSDISTTKSGDLLITGFVSNIIYSVYLMKVDALGNVVYYQHFDWPFSHYTYSVRELAGGGYFLFGNVYLNGGSETRNIILNVAEDGSLRWVKGYFDIPIWGRAEATSDGGVITRSGDVIYKIRSNGNVEWAREMSGSGYYASVPQEVDDGYVFARYSNAGVSDTSAYLFKMDFNGNLVWVGESFRSYEINEVEVLKSGEFVVYGHVYVDTISNPREFTAITRLSPQGRVLEQVVVVSPDDEVHKGTDLVVSASNAIYLCGREEDPLQPEMRLFLIKSTPALEFGNCDKWSFLEKKPAPALTLSPRIVSPQDLSFSQTGIVVSTSPAVPQEVMTCSEDYPTSISLGNDSIICPGETVLLSPGTFDFHRYDWSTGETTSEILVGDPGRYFLTVGIGCRLLSDTIEITHFPSTAPSYTISPEEIFPSRPVTFRSLTKNVTGVCFRIGENEPICDTLFHHFFHKNGRYPVIYTFTDTNGCMGSDTGFAEVDFQSIYIPNAFSPNSDGVNDEFGPSGFGLLSYHLMVFNSWGELIFEGNSQPWNGTSSGRQAASDNYIYKLDVVRDDGKKEHFSGSVQLL